MVENKAEKSDSDKPKIAKAKSKSSKQIELAESIPPLEYDLLDPSLNVLHRAGIAGLVLQIKAIDILREQAIDESKVLFPKVDWSYIENGRGIKVNFNLNTFRAVLRERYLGIPKLNVNEKTQPIDETDKTDKSKKKNNVEPSLYYLTTLGASEDLQMQTRRAYSDSFFSIYQERIGFFQHTEREEPNEYLQEKINSLWNAIANNTPIEIQKSSRPNIFGSDLKAIQLKEEGDKALLLHFWSVASSFFKPIGLKIEKDKKTKQLIIEEEHRLASSIVVPDIINIRTFVSEITSTYSKLSNNHISTPLEASLAFFLAAKLAHNEVISHDILGARGATVFAYKRPLKKGKPDFTTQPLVRSVSDIPLNENLLNQYRPLLDNLKSPPYKALRVENLLEGRVWHCSFDALVDKYPLELFVQTQKQNGDWELHPKAHELAQDLATDFYYFANKENKMDDKETNIPTLIDEIVSSYLRWRVYNKGQNPPSQNRMNAIFEMKRQNKPMSDQEDQFLKNYNELYSKGINKEFIDFRGATDQHSFAELFVARIFEAGQNTTPEQREMLRPFYEGGKWESGRWLVLMALSAANFPKKKL
jgi:CRISPR-associated protein Cmx8